MHMIEELDSIAQELEKKGEEIAQINIKQDAIDQKIREIEEELGQFKIEKDRLVDQNEKARRDYREGTFTDEGADHLTASMLILDERYEDIKIMLDAAIEAKKKLYHQWTEVMHEIDILEQRLLRTN